MVNFAPSSFNNQYNMLTRSGASGMNRPHYGTVSRTIYGNHTPFAKGSGYMWGTQDTYHQTDPLLVKSDGIMPVINERGYTGPNGPISGDGFHVSSNQFVLRPSGTTTTPSGIIPPGQEPSSETKVFNPGNNQPPQTWIEGDHELGDRFKILSGDYAGQEGTVIGKDTNGGHRVLIEVSKGSAPPKGHKPVKQNQPHS
jgi:hypothetical protein